MGREEKTVKMKAPHTRANTVSDSIYYYVIKGTPPSSSVTSSCRVVTLWMDPHCSLTVSSVSFGGPDLDVTWTNCNVSASLYGNSKYSTHEASFNILLPGSVDVL